MYECRHLWPESFQDPIIRIVNSEATSVAESLINHTHHTLLRDPAHCFLCFQTLQYFVFSDFPALLFGAFDPSLLSLDTIVLAFLPHLMRAISLSTQENPNGVLVLASV